MSAKWRTQMNHEIKSATSADEIPICAFCVSFDPAGPDAENGICRRYPPDSHIVMVQNQLSGAATPAIVMADKTVNPSRPACGEFDNGKEDNENEQ